MCMGQPQETLWMFRCTYYSCLLKLLLLVLPCCTILSQAFVVLQSSSFVPALLQVPGAGVAVVQRRRHYQPQQQRAGRFTSKLRLSHNLRQPQQDVLVRNGTHEEGIGRDDSTANNLSTPPQGDTKDSSSSHSTATTTCWCIRVLRTCCFTSTSAIYRSWSRLCI